MYILCIMSSLPRLGFYLCATHMRLKSVKENRYFVCTEQLDIISVNARKRFLKFLKTHVKSKS